MRGGLWRILLDGSVDYPLVGLLYSDLDGHLCAVSVLQTGSGCAGAAAKPGRLIGTREALSSWFPIRAASQGDTICIFSLVFFLFFLLVVLALNLP